MARLRVTNKAGLGKLILSAAQNEELKKQLQSDPERFLRPFVKEVPSGHKIKVVAEDDDTTVLVLPATEGVPKSAEQIEAVLREEARQYDEARQRVDESKKRRGSDAKSEIPEAVLYDTYALMIGNAALSPTSRTAD